LINSVESLKDNLFLYADRNAAGVRNKLKDAGLELAETHFISVDPSGEDLMSQIAGSIQGKPAALMLNDTWFRSSAAAIQADKVNKYILIKPDLPVAASQKICLGVIAQSKKQAVIVIGQPGDYQGIIGILNKFGTRLGFIRIPLKILDEIRKAAVAIQAVATSA